MAWWIHLVIMGGVVTVIGFVAACFCGNRWLWLALNLGFPIICFAADHIKPIEQWGKKWIQISVNNATSEDVRNVEIVSEATDLSLVGSLGKGQEGTIMCLVKVGQRLSVVLEVKGGKAYRVEIPMFEWNERLPQIRLTIRDAQIGQRVSEGGSLFTVVVEK